MTGPTRPNAAADREWKIITLHWHTGISINHDEPVGRWVQCDCSNKTYESQWERVEHPEQENEMVYVHARENDRDDFHSEKSCLMPAYEQEGSLVKNPYRCKLYGYTRFLLLTNGPTAMRFQRVEGEGEKPAPDKPCAQFMETGLFCRVPFAEHGKEDHVFIWHDGPVSPKPPSPPPASGTEKDGAKDRE